MSLLKRFVKSNCVEYQASACGGCLSRWHEFKIYVAIRLEKTSVNIIRI
jgi:hypothetical protein